MILTSSRFPDDGSSDNDWPLGNMLAHSLLIMGCDIVKIFTKQTRVLNDGLIFQFLR